MSRTKNAKRNITWGFVSKIESIIMPFICRTVMIYTLGMQYIGLGSLFSSLLSVLSFAELGIGSALVFSMYEPIAKSDDDKVCALLYFYKKCYLVIGTVIGIAGLAVMPFLDKLIAGDVPEDINIYILYLLILLNTVIGYFFSAYRSSLLTATQRVDIANILSMVMNFILNVVQIVVLLVLKNYYVYIEISIITTLIYNVAVYVITRKIYPQYTCRGNLTRQELDSIKENVGGMVFQKIGNIVLTSVDTIVISAFLGLKILGIYNGYYYIITAITGFITVISGSLIPSVGNSIATEGREKNHNDLKKFQFLYVWLLGWWGSCLLCLYQPFIRMWQGEENMLPFVMAILLSLYFYIHHMGDLSYVYREAVGLWWQGKFVPLISSIVNLSLNIWLVQVIGLPGIVISTIVSILLINDTLGSAVLFKYYFKSKKYLLEYYVRMLKYLLQAVITATVTYLTCSLLPEIGIVSFIIKIFICIIIPNLVLGLLNVKSKIFAESLEFVYRLIPSKIIPSFLMTKLKRIFG